MRNIAIGAVLLIAVIAMYFFFIRNGSGPTTSEAPTQQEQVTSPTEEDSTRTGSTSVEIEGFAYSPSDITIKKGMTVTWTNRDEMEHTVTADAKSPNAPDSPMLSQGESYSFTFDTPGTYSYHCAPHPYMRATVTVTE